MLASTWEWFITSTSTGLHFFTAQPYTTRRKQLCKSGCGDTEARRAAEVRDADRAAEACSASSRPLEASHEGRRGCPLALAQTKNRTQSIQSLDSWSHIFPLLLQYYFFRLNLGKLFVKFGRSFVNLTICWNQNSTSLKMNSAKIEEHIWWLLKWILSKIKWRFSNQTIEQHLARKSSYQ